MVAAQASLLAFLTKRPVKLIYDREEDIISTSKRHPGIVDYKSGVTKDGRLIACEAKYILDSGAYTTLSPVVLWRGTVHSIGPYKCPNVKVDGYAVRTNKVPCGAMRGFGIPQIAFAVESQMDELARSLKIDPYRFRLKNIIREGDETATGHRLKSSVGLEETLVRAKEASNWGKNLREEGNVKKGIGLSSVFYGAGLGAEGKRLDKAGAYVKVNSDATVNFAVGTTEMGQGMITVLSQILSSELGIPLDKISMVETDTTRVPDSGPTVASRATMLSGNAIIDACREIRKSILKVGRDLLKSPVRIKEGFVYSRGKKVPIEIVIEECYKRRERMSAEGWWIPPKTSFREKNGQGNAYYTYVFATNIAEVEVNTKTGEIGVLRIISANDVGKAINPQLVEGQIEGGVVQGIGYALTEEILMDEGRIVNPDLSTYIIPTVEDIPEIKPIIVEHPWKPGPYGAKGFGELPLIGVAPAITNAIYDACGVRIRELPATPEKILTQIKIVNCE